MTSKSVRNLMMGVAMAGAVLAAGAGAQAQDANSFNFIRYKVTIQNATFGQGIAPSLLVFHNRNFSLFEVGDTATPGLEDLAEIGDSQARADELIGAPGVGKVVVAGDAPTPPSGSVSAEVLVPRGFRYLSAAAMLGITNDAFYGVRNVRLPLLGSIRVDADAYDAGTEVNTETAEDVAGLGGKGSEDENGFIHVHPGVNGVGGEDGLDPATHDWRNPVVEITIERM